MRLRDRFDTDADAARSGAAPETGGCAGSSGKAAMAEQELDGAYVDAGLKQMCFEGISEAVRGDPLDQPGQGDGPLAGLLDGVPVDMAAGNQARE